MSVKLLSRTPMRAIRSLALDEGSRTSGVLARILLFQRFGLCPRLETLPANAEVSQCTADAVLLIGDRAIHPPMDDIVDCWDLGDQWCRWAELPFVFAMWVARAGVNTTGLDALLNDVRDAGVMKLPQIARTEAESVGLTVPETLQYLRDHLHFRLGPREKRGLGLYYQMAARIGAASATTELALDDCRIA
jgi:chorismate dehydratase